MTYEAIVAKVKEALLLADVSKIDEHLAIQVNVEGEGEGIFYIEVKDNALYVEPYDYYDRDAIFFADAETLVKLADGKLDAVKAYTAGSLRIEGNVEKSLLFKSIVDSAKKAKKAAAPKTTKKSAPKAKAETKKAAPAKKEAPKAEAKVEAPKAEAKVEAPKAEAKVEAPKAEAKVEAPKTEAKAAPKAKTVKKASK